MLGTLACMHVDAGAPNFYVQEFFHDFNVPWEKDLFTHPPECREGYLDLPTRPGLGTELNLEEVRRHPYTDTLDMNLFEHDWHKRREAATGRVVLK
jgi:galactonate dehydratase